jgi:oxygen-dependent protoporphyrinogen oxidase
MNVAVLGGGVTGLTAALRMTQAGHAVTLLESSARTGGNVRTEAGYGWLVERGPNSIMETTAALSALVDELSLRPERIESEPAAKNRYIVVNGRLVPLPAPPPSTELMSTPLLSLGAKMGIMKEATLQPRERPADVSVATLARDHFGREVLDRIVQPFVGGIFAGDAERLSAKHAFPTLWEAERTVGSLIRAAKAQADKRKAAGLPASPPMISFKRGLQALTDALAARLPEGTVVLEAEVRSLASLPGARWRVSWEGPGGADSREFDRVVAALPAGSLARLEIGGAFPLEGLGAIEYPALASVFVGFRRADVSHPLDGFGALVPVAEGRFILGAIFSSTLFPGRAPEGHVALTAFVGGALRPENALLTREALIEGVCRDLRELVGARGSPVFARHMLWPKAIPQYNLGYGAHLDALARCERDNPGLFFGGNVRDGISLPDCIKSGTSLAARVS